MTQAERDKILTGALRARCRRIRERGAEITERVVDEVMDQMAYEAQRGDDRIACKQALEIRLDERQSAYRRYRKVILDVVHER